MATLDIEEVKRAVESGQAAGEEVGVSWLQRRFRLGFGTATALKSQLIELGVVFLPIGGNGPEHPGVQAGPKA